MVISLIKILILLALIVIVLGFLRTVDMERTLNENNNKFRAGTTTNLPEGLYSGTLPGHTVSWKGKKFNQADMSGINVFDAGDGKQVEKYPFKFYIAKGVRDGGKEVIRIDYNLPGNPFWLRFILDEIVEVTPGKYIGKLNTLLIPHYPFTLGFFELTK